MLGSTLSRSVEEGDAILGLGVRKMSLSVERISFVTEKGYDKFGLSNLLAKGIARDGS
jgi:hypothetical protein